MEHPVAYLPTDRRIALARGEDLPDHSSGAALFADISGFTPLTEALVHALGRQRGAEELPHQLNQVYSALIAETDRYGGSVLAFSGDAITCWFAEDDARQTTQTTPFKDAIQRAVACALAIQTTMQQFAAIEIAGVGTVGLAIKVAVTAGSARRFIVGDPTIQLIDALAGETIARLAVAEHLAERGDTVIDAVCAAALGEFAQIREWRHDHETHLPFAVIDALSVVVTPRPWPPIDDIQLSDEQLRAWLLNPVYDRLHSNQGEFLTELRPAVALFLRFSGLDYDNDPYAGAKLDAYMRWAMQQINEMGGFLLQLTIGDKGSYFYAGFGAPVSYENTTVRALYTAQRLVETPPELSYIGDVQIGVSQGVMRTGSYGATSRRTYSVLGDGVNLAARLMQAAGPGQIYVSSVVRKDGGDSFVWWSLPPIKVKGKSETLKIFRLLDVQQRHTIRLQESQYSLPMVGRIQEMNQINAWMASCLTDGKGQIIGITAEAGMGKSRLIAEVIKRADMHQIRIYGGECQSYGTNTSYLVWQNIWRAFFNIPPGAGNDIQIATLTREIEQINPTLLQRLPLLGAVLNLSIPDSELTAAFDAKLRKTSLEAFLVDCLHARAASEPILLVLEDCHWLDPLSHDLLEVIGRAVADVPVLIVMAYRPMQIERLIQPRVTTLPHFHEVMLDTLPADNIAEFVRMKLAQYYGDDIMFPAALTAQIHDRAQGNPFYIEELLNYMRDRGVDLQRADALKQIELPSSLSNLILSRVDQLTENQKTVLKVASVIGRLFRATMLWGAYSQFNDYDRVLQDLDVLSSLDLTHLDSPAPELIYLFKHILTQEVVYETLPFAMRAVLHNQIGCYIEQTYADMLEQYIDLLAYHFDLSENLPKRREYLLKAGELAQASYANQAALSYYQRVIPLLVDHERCATLLKIGQVYDTIGQWGEADEYSRQGLVLAEQLGDLPLQLQAQIALGELRRRQGNQSEAVNRYAAARQLAEKLNDQPGIAKVLICAGTLAVQQGDFELAQERYLQSLYIRSKLDDQLNIANVYNNMCIVAYHQGDLPRALELQEESLRIRRTLNDKWVLANSLNNLGFLLTEQGNSEQARRYLEEAIVLQRQIGDPSALANTLHSLANLERNSGDYPTAFKLYRESISISMRIGERWTLLQSIEDFAWLLALSERAADAVRLVSAAAAARTRLSLPLSVGEQTRLDEVINPARASIGAYAEVIAAEGESLTLEQVVDLIEAA